MYQVIPLKFLVLGAAWLAVSVLLLVTWAIPSISGLSVARCVAFVVNALLVILMWKPVWRFFWRKIPALSNWFPDLNGEYDVELRHNRPVQERMLQAASGGQPFDPRLATTELPSLGIAKLRASIDLRFASVHVRMWSENPDEPASVIDESRTLVSSLLRPCDGQPARLIYVYQQKNRRDRRQVTDDSTFEGAAILNVPPGASNELRGEYWTNRASHQGLSTAGIIHFKKRATDS